MELWQLKFSTCRVCEKPVDVTTFEHALRDFTRPSCSTECTRVEYMQHFACCLKAEVYPCVCAHSFECPDHGIRHIGTHD